MRPGREIKQSFNEPRFAFMDVLRRHSTLSTAQRVARYEVLFLIFGCWDYSMWDVVKNDLRLARVT